MEQNQKSTASELAAELLEIDLAEFRREIQEIEAEFGQETFIKVQASLGQFVRWFRLTTRSIVKYITSFLEYALLDEPFAEELKCRVMKEQVWNLQNNVSDFPAHFELEELVIFGHLPRWVLPNRVSLYRYVLLSQIIHPMCYLILLEEGKVVVQNKELVRMEQLVNLYNVLEEIHIQCDIIDDDYMERIKKQVEQSAAMKLHGRLVSAGAYERLMQLDPRRATMLQTYLTTEKSIPEIGREAGLRSRTQSHQLIHSSMELAFFTLPENERAEYDNNPAIALRTRSGQQTKTKGERIKEAHSQLPKNPETGKIQFSDTHILNLQQAASDRWRRHREEQAEQAGTIPNQP